MFTNRYLFYDFVSPIMWFYWVIVTLLSIYVVCFAIWIQFANFLPNFIINNTNILVDFIFFIIIPAIILLYPDRDSKFLKKTESKFGSIEIFIRVTFGKICIIFGIFVVGSFFTEEKGDTIFDIIINIVPIIGEKDHGIHYQALYLLTFVILFYLLKPLIRKFSLEDGELETYPSLSNMLQQAFPTATLFIRDKVEVNKIDDTVYRNIKILLILVTILLSPIGAPVIGFFLLLILNLPQNEGYELFDNFVLNYFSGMYLFSTSHGWIVFLAWMAAAIPALILPIIYLCIVVKKFVVLLVHRLKP